MGLQPIPDPISSKSTPVEKKEQGCGCGLLKKKTHPVKTKAISLVKDNAFPSVPVLLQYQQGLILNFVILSIVYSVIGVHLTRKVKRMIERKRLDSKGESMDFSQSEYWNDPRVKL